MHFFNSGLFWFIEGVFTCLVVIGLKIWMEDKGIPMPFWKWLLLGLWADLSYHRIRALAPSSA